jgi:signal transduction histidine kinase
MKILPKLTLSLVTGTCLILAVNGYFRVRREVAQFERDRLREHEMIGRSLGAAVTSVWRTEGEEPAMASIEAVNRRFTDIHVRFVGPDARKTSSPPGEPVTEIGGTGARTTWFTYVPIEVGGTPRGFIELADPAPGERNFTRAAATDALRTALALALLSAVVAFGMGQWLVGAPVRALIEKARKIGRGDFSGQVVLKQKDEFGLLAKELNAMSQQLVSTLEQLRHADRLTTVGQLASGVAHELGTPLNVVLARAQMIASGDTTPEEAKEYASVVVAATERMAKIIRQLLQFARRKGPQRAPTDIRALVREVLDLLRPLSTKRGVSVVVAGSDDGTKANVEVGQLQQVITNLVMNAVQATSAGGRVEVALTSQRARAPEGDAPEQSCLCLRVKDTGAGIAAEHLPRIFEPFFTTKDIGEGTGLGLAVTYGIVRDHGGWITVDSAAGKGTTFSIFLPRAE